MKIMRILKNAFVMVCVVAAVNAAAQENPAESSSGFEWGAFRANQISVFQAAGFSLSGELTWNPGYHFSNSPFGLRLILGGTFLNQAGGGLFPSADYGLLATYDLSKNLILEAGYNGQLWISSPIAHFLGAEANVGYKFDHKILWLVERVFVGYSALFGTNFTSAVRGGVQINF